MNSTPTTGKARIGATVLALGIILGLTGCLQPAARSTSSPTPSPSSSSSPIPTSTAAAPIPTATPTRFVEACGTLLSPAQVYAYNPNYVVDPAYAPKPGTVAAQIKAALGQNCGWIDETSRAELEVGVAQPTPSAFALAKSAAASGTPITVNGEPGYFAVSGGVGSAQFFIGTLWLDVSSVDFGTAADASAVYPTVVRNQLGAGG